jgi:FkbM family methyltransferase
MREWIRSSEGLRFIYWSLRAFFGLQTKSHYELLYRLKHHAETFGWETSGTFRFPWGSFEYVSMGQLIIQYEEIFQKRHYAFKPEVLNPVIVDCGGNVGLSALWFKQNYPSCHLSVFEPDQNLARLIKKNLASAGITDAVCLPKAAWVEDGSIGFDLRGDDRGKIVAEASQTVESVDLAKWLPDSTDLLKLDIEGAEFDVIEHLCETGAIRRIKNLVCELHIMRGTEPRMLNLLQHLINEGMQISLNYGAVGPWIGLAKETSPFEVIGRNHLFIELYAWRNGSESDASRMSRSQQKKENSPQQAAGYSAVISIKNPPNFIFKVS